jgi:hypothetical protein
LLIVLLRNLTIYEINLQNLTLFLAKMLFCLFGAGNDGNKIGENTMEVFMEKKRIKTKEGTRGHLARKQDHVAWPAGGTVPPRSV